jgi:hypothetical protein
MKSRLPSERYASLFADWDKRAWVRSKPRRRETFSSSLYYFSPAVSFLPLHERVKMLPDQAFRELLVLQLFAYLEFTVWLELGPVNEMCDAIRRPSFLPWLPDRMRADALKIYVDEAGHAEMSSSLMADVADATGLLPLRVRPSFLHTLDTLAGSTSAFMDPLIRLLFVIVSETLITGSLLRLPRDESVQPSVRHLAADHAEDESRHHAFFREVFERLWPRLPRQLQSRLGLLLPSMLAAFLEPDVAVLTACLSRFPSNIPHPEKVILEIAGMPEVREGIRASARPTLQMFRTTGLFEDPAVLNAFIEAGLLV